MERLVIYLRLSKEDDYIKDESNSITNQRLLLRSYVRNHPDLKDMEIIEIKDDGYTGKTMDRPGMKQLTQLIKNGQISCIVVKDFSRFSRDQFVLGEYIEKILPFMQIRFISVSDDYDSDRNVGGIAEIDTAFKAILNDSYSEDISEKVKTSLDARRASGKYIATFAIYGYRKSKEDKHVIEIDEEAAAVVREIFSEYKDGKSMYAIAESLNSRGVLTPGEYASKNLGYTFKSLNQKKAGWNTVKVSRILHSEMYAGIFVYGKSRMKQIGVRSGNSVPKEEWKRIYNHHDPIIDEDTFLKVQARLEKNRKPKASGKAYNFKGKVMCANCGGKMRHDGRGIPGFACVRFYGNDKSLICGTTIKDYELEEIVINLLKEKIEDEKNKLSSRKKLLAEAKEMQSNLQMKIHNLDKKLKLLTEEELLAYEKLKSEELSDTNYFKERERILEERKNFSEKKAELEEKLSSTEQDIFSFSKFNAEGLNLCVDELTPALVDHLIEAVIVGRGSIEIKWKFAN